MAYSASTARLGIVDLNAVVTTLGSPGIGNLPSVTTEPQLGEIVTGWDTSLGGGEFIFLAVPTTTVIAAGSMVNWDANYRVALLPTTVKTGLSVGVAIAAFASNAALQYGWFQIQGKATTLKTAVTVSPNSAVFITTTTTGRVQNVSSTGRQIIGARTANTATVTSTTSTVLVFLNRSAVQGA